MNDRGKTVSLILLLVALSGCSSVWKATLDPTADNLSLSSANAPLPSEARKAHLAFAYEPPKTMSLHERSSVYLLVKNLGLLVWPYSAEGTSKYQIRVGNHWIDRNGNVEDDGRASLPYDLRPGDTAEILIVVTTPEVPGEYTLEFDLVQEQVAWFADAGSKTLRATVEVK